MENVINNTEPKPSIPRGVYGRWEWDGNTTARQRSIDGHEWLLKGAWRWVTEQKKVQAPLAKVSVSSIVEHHKPTVMENNKIEKAFNSLFILCGIVIAITLITFIII